MKVARAHSVPEVPMIVLETALPIKFAETIERLWAASRIVHKGSMASRTCRSGSKSFPPMHRL